MYYMYISRMIKKYVKKNVVSSSIIIFVILFTLMQYLQPGFLYEKDGSLRTFGIGKKKKTILPIWLLSLILAFLSYLGVLYYINMPNLF